MTSTVQGLQDGEDDSLHPRHLPDVYIPLNPTDNLPRVRTCSGPAILSAILSPEITQNPIHHVPSMHHSMSQNPSAHTVSLLPSQSHRPARSPYLPDKRELHPGAKNRLFLALRSTIGSEVDWALPRLILASIEHAERFRLETWVDSVGALQAWPERWLEGLEKEAALMEVRKEGVSTMVLGAIPEWTEDPAVEIRAIHSLLILRNASILNTNAKIICRATFLAFLDRFFGLPIPFLLEISLRSPEPFQHILVILQSIFTNLQPSPRIIHLFSRVLPALLVDTRDLAMLNLLLPLMNISFTLPNLSIRATKLLPHVLYLLALSPAPPLLELTLDLLISLTLQTSHAKAVLSDPSFPAHLKTLVMLLEHGARPTQASWENPASLQGVMVRNPAGGAAMAEEASRRRTMAREASQRDMEIFGGPGVFALVGDRQPVLGQVTKSKLYSLPEPRRSIAWYVSHSRLLPRMDSLR